VSTQAKANLALARVAYPAVAGNTPTMRAQTFLLVAATAVFVAPLACDRSSDAAAPAAGAHSADSAAGGGTGSPSGTGGYVDDTSCDRAPCEGFTVGAISYAACCIPRADACGVRVGNTCVERTAFAPPAMGSVGAGVNLGDPEVVVPDPTCPPLTSVMGMAVSLPGCCDISGVCGVSTAGIGTTMGFKIPPMCVTTSDPLGSYLASPGAPVPCDYPEDAGTLPTDGG
jgi:hypothetical protein